MTQQEHWAVAALFAQQMQMSMILLDILRSRLDLSEDDVQAFASVAAMPPNVAALMTVIRSQYESVFHAVGLEVSLESV
jgi:hypothetical protein